MVKKSKRLLINLFEKLPYYNKFQYNPNIGVNPYSDFDYIDIDNSLYPMTGSIFGAMPMVGGYGNLGTNQTFFDNMKQQQQFYNQYYVDQYKMQRNADLQINGAMESIAGSCQG